MSSAKDALAAAKSAAKEQAIAVADEPKKEFELEVLAKIKNLDWKKLPPPLMARLLCERPYPPAYKGGPPRYLTFPQATWLALWATQEDVSPLGNEIVFQFDTWACSLTTEGQKHKLRNLQIEATPPVFRFIERSWPNGRGRKAPPELWEIVEVPDPVRPGKTTLKEQPPANDRGCVCRIEVWQRGEWKPSEYTAWLSEWIMVRNSNWLERTDHMLQTRAYDKAMENVTGVGISAPIPEVRDEVVRPVEREAPTVWTDKGLPLDGLNSFGDSPSFENKSLSRKYSPNSLQRPQSSK